MRNWLRTVLLYSAFSPAFISLAYVRYDISGAVPEVYLWAGLGVFGIASTLVILKAIQSNSEKFTFTAKKGKPNDWLIVMFIGSYLLPIIARASELNMLKTTLLTVGIFAVMWLISFMPVHPLLWLLKFRFYEVESSTGFVYTLICRRELRNPNEIKSVRQISSTLLIEAE